MTNAFQKRDWFGESLTRFLTESLAIEGIYRGPTELEFDATVHFLSQSRMTIQAIVDLQRHYAPEKPIRAKASMNVRVGKYVAPPGGKAIEHALAHLAAAANTGDNPWTLHVEFEALHPFMDGNGRTGRALWAWCMQKVGEDPFGLPFLHRFYYQTLANSRTSDANRHA